jgi:hypothetical protein
LPVKQTSRYLQQCVGTNSQGELGCFILVVGMDGDGSLNVGGRRERHLGDQGLVWPNDEETLIAGAALTRHPIVVAAEIPVHTCHGKHAVDDDGCTNWHNVGGN